MKVAVFNIFILLSCNSIVSQTVEVVDNEKVSDTLMIPTVDTIESINYNRPQIVTVGTSIALFNENTQSQSTYNLQYNTSKIDKWNIGGGLYRIVQGEISSSKFNINVQRTFDKGGVGILMEKSDDVLAPESHQQISFYKVLKDDLFFSGSVSRFTSTTRSDVWPNYLSLTKVIYGIGYTIGMSHDLGQLNSFSPLAKASVTHESKKGDILNAYFTIGRILQPNYQITNLPIDNHLTGFGGWFKKNITKRISIIGALGLTSIRNKNGSQFKIINSNISISSKI